MAYKKTRGIENDRTTNESYNLVKHTLDTAVERFEKQIVKKYGVEDAVAKLVADEAVSKLLGPMMVFGIYKYRKQCDEYFFAANASPKTEVVDPTPKKRGRKPAAKK